MNKQILTFKELREARGYTQESLARAVGLSRLAISRYELRQAEPKVGNFLKIAQILEVSLAELALAMGYEFEEQFLQVYGSKSAFAPAPNEALERDHMQVYDDKPRCAPAKKQSESATGGESKEKYMQVREAKLAPTPAYNETLEPKQIRVHNDKPKGTPAKRQSKSATGDESEEKSMPVHEDKSVLTPAHNETLERESVAVLNGLLGHTPAKRRAKGKGTGFIEERLVKRGNKQYKQYWFHWQKTKPGKGRVFATSKYIPKRLVAKIIGKNNQKLPVREILQSLGVKK